MCVSSSVCACVCVCVSQVSHVYPGGCHMGQLTRQGQLQARDLGEWLRERYVNRYQLLPPTHQVRMQLNCFTSAKPQACHMCGCRPHNRCVQLGTRQKREGQSPTLPVLPVLQEGVIATRTTPYQRTIGTLAGVLTGLFGPPQRSTKPITTVTSTDVDEIL